MKFEVCFVLFSVLIITRVFGQTAADLKRKEMADSIKAVYLEEAAIRFPAMRQVVISTDFISNGSISGILNGREVYQGKADMQRITALFKVPVSSWGKNSLSASFSILQQKTHFTEIESSGSVLEPEKLNFNRVSVGINASYTRIDSLFGRQTVYLANISGLTNEVSSLRKVSYLAGGMVLLKQNRNTSLRVGLMVIIDPFISVPVIPVASYWHRFNISHVELTADLTRIGAKRQMTKDLWASVGTSLSGSSSFFRTKYPSIPNDYNYTMTELKTGAGLEFRLLKKLMVGAEGGLMSPLSARAFEQGKKSNDYFFKNELNTRPYCNLTLSLLPFKFH